jgi:hypothetical protein
MVTVLKMWLLYLGAENDFSRWRASSCLDVDTVALVRDLGGDH